MLHYVCNTGIPYIRWYGVEGSYNVLVMDLLGYSLEDLFNRCGRHFTLKTTLMIADQVLLRVEYIHSKSFIHRDIKPDNFLIGAWRQWAPICVVRVKSQTAPTGTGLPRWRRCGVSSPARVVFVWGTVGTDGTLLVRCPRMRVCRLGSPLQRHLRHRLWLSEALP